MTVRILDTDHFARVLEFALSVKAADKLIERLDYLSHYGDDPTTCNLYPDLAPNSFTVTMLRKDGSYWFSGGLIYSGPTQPLDGSAPALTVGIGIDSSKPGWSLHT